MSFYISSISFSIPHSLSIPIFPGSLEKMKSQFPSVSKIPENVCQLVLSLGAANPTLKEHISSCKYNPSLYRPWAKFQMNDSKLNLHQFQKPKMNLCPNLIFPSLLSVDAGMRCMFQIEQRFINGSRAIGLARGNSSSPFPTLAGNSPFLRPDITWNPKKDIMSMSGCGHT